MRKLILCMAMLLLTTVGATAQDFDRYFQDKTLRIDYIFSGDRNTQHLALDELMVEPRWYGKRRRLAEVPVEGNGQITVRDHRTGRVIYRNSFSTLFQEWQQEPEALHTTKAFENVFLVPMPRDTADVTVDLRDNRRQVCARLTHQVVPTDILIRPIGQHGVTPYELLQQAADTANCIHLAYLAEGYRAEEMGAFIADARAAMEALFEHEPFKSSRSRFNIVAVKSPSAESGASNPGKGIWKNTALHSHWYTNYSERYLTTSRLKDMHDLLAGTPYEHILVLVNSDGYGGGGILNSYILSTTRNAWAKPVVVHEFGHSFAGLADEYAYDAEPVDLYPLDVEPWEKNITTRVDFRDKWENLLGKDKAAGFYEGAGYKLKGVYRAYEDCRMRTNETPEFCPACRQALQALIDFYTR
ncbi:IgA Peptidase M64 [Prevotella dentalis DSM 3688]|uniref:IgA Peptidase M64 n=1 Tax=Prevotella dentalis (strain ATCC 49559 / DSM 3688 / JCM 13448 / NCTC 12043 / ES 2772) TaxID=908937 RepID=F9D5J4_PREDD|nr:M64 family metallopeptidase [Prevotella dentalis]AGB29227.1 IgA Peptidase M64 [Prevotella dentalis DSM 3688]EGQ13146.1 IgA peptidase M64 superfamily protein [Prevotella dentalis DSM 3688]